MEWGAAGLMLRTFCSPGDSKKQPGLRITAQEFCFEESQQSFSVSQEKQEHNSSAPGLFSDLALDQQGLKM